MRHAFSAQMQRAGQTKVAVPAQAKTVPSCMSCSMTLSGMGAKCTVAVSTAQYCPPLLMFWTKTEPTVDGGASE